MPAVSDARILLRLLSRRPRVSYSTADIVAMNPRHMNGGSTRVAMDEGQVTDALAELSGHDGWLGNFSTDRYVFRALTPGMPEDSCNPDPPAHARDTRSARRTGGRGSR